MLLVLSIAAIGAFALLPASAQAQRADGLLPRGGPVHRFLKRQQAAGRLPSAFLSHQPLSAYEAQTYLDSLAERKAALSAVDRQLLARYRYEAPGPHATWANERVSWLYENGQDFFSTQTDDFALQVSPLLYLTYGRARQSKRGDRNLWMTTWQNTRGVRATGHLRLGSGVRLFFDTQIEETQRRDPNPTPYAKRTAPRLHRVIFDDGVYDYNTATGGIGLRSDHFEVRVGRWRNQWGPGGSSLLLSDYAPAYDQIQIRTSVWRLQYTNLFAAFNDLTFVPPGGSYRDQELPRRFGVFHRLAIRLPKRIEVGLFESVIFADRESGNRQDGFDISYLNPLIFYRSVQLDRGSPGNLLMGADTRWTATPGIDLYGQLLLDEFVIDDLFTSSWNDKWGGMLGLHLAGVLAPRLSLRLEYTRLRPFLYTHREPATAYLQYDDLLGHPAGPNTWDASLRANYHPAANVDLALNVSYTRAGRSTDSLRVGDDPRRSYNERFSDVVPLLSGVRQNEVLLEARASYELLPSMWLEGALRYHALDDAKRGTDRYAAPQFSLRWGLPFRSARY